MGLNAKQSLFVAEYLIDSNATQAAIRAGYSEKTAGQIGHELLKKPEIQAQLSKARSERVTRTEISADWVLMQQASLLAQTVAEDPEIARKTLRDIGDGIGMYTEKVEHTVTNLSPEDRLNRVASLLSTAKQRIASTNGNGNGKH